MTWIRVGRRSIKLEAITSIEFTDRPPGFSLPSEPPGQPRLQVMLATGYAGEFVGAEAIEARDKLRALGVDVPWEDVPAPGIHETPLSAEQMMGKTVCVEPRPVPVRTPLVVARSHDPCAPPQPPAGPVPSGFLYGNSRAPEHATDHHGRPVRLYRNHKGELVAALREDGMVLNLRDLARESAAADAATEPPKEDPSTPALPPRSWRDEPPQL